jgi:predicted 2-oxoglutarate/Fe(II)-dependent dioxygenase YbiX
MLMSYPASKQGPLATGERLHDLAFLDAGGQPFSLYNNRVYGWPKAIHVAASPEDALVELERFASLSKEFGQTETHVLAITRAPAEANLAVVERLKLPFPVLSDPEGALHKAAGLDEPGAAVTLLLDPVLRLERKVTGADGPSQAEAALAHVRARAKVLRPSVVAAQAPILVVPNVLDRDHCRRLMTFWEQGQKLDNTVASSQERSQRANTKTKIRADVIVPDDSPESKELVDVMGRRLLPEVLKGFTFRVSRMEHFRVGCYDSTDGGHFAPHRDNTTPLTKHRRYALTLNLNTDEYEGGFLRFPEYGPQLYAPPAGGAVVFSCSLLHLASPVTSGRRFVIVGFFWGEEEHKVYERTNAGLTFEESLSV